MKKSRKNTLKGKKCKNKIKIETIFLKINWEAPKLCCVFVISFVVPNSLPCYIMILLKTKVANLLWQVIMFVQIVILLQNKGPNTHEKEEKIAGRKRWRKARREIRKNNKKLYIYKEKTTKKKSRKKK